jgi:hypothetical protein
VVPEPYGTGALAVRIRTYASGIPLSNASIAGAVERRSVNLEHSQDRQNAIRSVSGQQGVHIFRPCDKAKRLACTVRQHRILRQTHLCREP